MICKYCSRECKNKNSLMQHEIRCKKNPDRKAFDNFTKWIVQNIKGKNKYNCDQIRKQSKKIKEGYASGRIKKNEKFISSWKGKKHTEEQKNKIGKAVSKSRIEGYASGRIKPAKGVGRGKYSYFIYNSHKFMLRSTYEMIYAIYLALNNISFDMEAIRVSALEDNIYGKTFISDFSWGNTVIEIKGIKSGKDKYIKEAFLSKGYNFKELFYEDIMKIKEKLINEYHIDMDKILTNVIVGHNSKNYFVLDFLNMCEYNI